LFSFASSTELSTRLTCRGNALSSSVAESERDLKRGGLPSDKIEP
jgi:hypothetical protein